MLQLFQDGKTGRIEVVELAEPALAPGRLLVHNACSVVSPGTERSTVSAGQDSLITTARNRPDLVRRVVDMVQRDGVLTTYQKVRTKLAEPKALGYSSAGTVIAVGPGCGDYFRVGDRVACGGQGVASHAGVVSVPVNLAARVPEGVDFASAAFTTMGAIALQGVRQAQPTLGERWAVIGLGILGQIGVQLLKAHGCRVAAFDLQQELVDQALDLGAEVGSSGGTADQVAAALAWTEGLGVDGVLVYAATKSDAPMIAAGGMCRDRARVVVVGAVPYGMPRDIAFAKELDLRIARSYGPGRYDMRYEEKGHDYPPGYVRWTEARNFEAFLHLLSTGQVTVAPLITHRHPIEEGPAAYAQLMDGEERVLGMVLDYPDLPPGGIDHSPRPVAGPSRTRAVSGSIGVAFVGAGSFARGTLLPLFAKADGIRMRTVVTSRSLSALDAARAFGFDKHGTDFDAVLDDPGVHAVCIATRHDLHATLAAAALRAGKHVFVEKPLAVDEEGLEEVLTAARESEGVLMVGFNRRFSPMVVQIGERVASRGPVMVSLRVNAGLLPGTHWLHDPVLGGGRIIGEGCHFVDLALALGGDAPIVSLHAEAAGRSEGLAQDVAVLLKLANGSVAQLVYTSQGDSSLGKERVEVFGGGLSAWIDDYASGAIHVGNKAQKLKGKGKGHAEEVQGFVEAVRSGGASPTPLAVLDDVTRATFRIHQLLSEAPSL